MASALIGMTGTCCSSRPCPVAESESDESEENDCCVGVTYSTILKEAGLCVHEAHLTTRARGDEAIVDDYVMETELDVDDELIIQSELNLVDDQILSLSHRITFGGAVASVCWQLLVSTHPPRAKPLSRCRFCLALAQLIKCSLLQVTQLCWHTTRRRGSASGRSDAGCLGQRRSIPWASLQCSRVGVLNKATSFVRLSSEPKGTEACAQLGLFGPAGHSRTARAA